MLWVGWIIKLVGKNSWIILNKFFCCKKIVRKNFLKVNVWLKLKCFIMLYGDFFF